MARMKRLLLLGAVVLAAAAVPAHASAGGPCRNDIYDDWYQDGKIASTYPVACYRDAVAHVHGDLKIYSSLIDDIRAAMQAAISRVHGTVNVPSQVGKGLPKSEVALTNPNASGGTAATGRTDSSVGVSTIAAPPVADSTDGGSGVPLPILVLAGLALLLAAAGGVGMLARRRG